MKWTAAALTSEDSLLRTFLSNLMEELDRTDEFLTRQQAQDFLDYYKRYHAHPLAGESLEREVRGGIRSTYGYTLSRLLRQRRDGTLRFLDAGSGFGTEVLLFALAGAQVTGIDLREERHEVARKRARFYEQQLDLPLNVDFRLSSVFNLEERDHFDLIWVHNAITHIDPVDRFLQLCMELLAPEGELVIVDVNKMNLRRRLRSAHHHEESLCTRYRDPATGKEVDYAVERDLALPEQCRLLREHGFDVVSHECYVGFHARTGKRFYETVLRPINRSMFLSSRLGGRYVVVGRKPRSVVSQARESTA